MATRIQIRRGSSADWTNANPVLAEGELGLELDTGRIKVGLGTTSWNNLDYRYGTAAAGSDTEVIFNNNLALGATSNFTFDKNTSTLKIGGVSGIGINTSTIKINGTDVLSSNTLGSGIVNSSLTSVGTLNQLNISGVTTSNAYYIGSTQVISSGRQLQNITSLDSTTTSTIESAVAAAPNDFTSLNITGISTLQGLLNVGVAGTVITATTAGKVGINSTIPQTILDVGGDINSSTDVKIDGISVLTTASNDALALAIALG